uniref:Conotoxin superfamily O1 n=1 Tax=Haemonchus contortus TaxID=6289 RepID=A0A7I4YTT0_HAECO
MARFFSLSLLLLALLMVCSVIPSVFSAGAQNEADKKKSNEMGKASSKLKRMVMRFRG